MVPTHCERASSGNKPHIAVCVFCGSGHGEDPAFEATAKKLGTFLANENMDLVYGGGDMGLMGALSQSAIEAGGKVTGIIPEFLTKYQNGTQPGQTMIVTSTMHERKARMYEMANAFIALPGGIGTLEELVETMTWEQLGQHKKPIILMNTNQFWEPFLRLLKHMKSHHFIRPGLEVNFHVEEDVNTLRSILLRANQKAD